MHFETMNIGGRQFDFKHAYVVGILNVTPDSFSDGGQYYDPQKAVEHCLKMIDEGADIIDIGGESTRPGSKPVSVRDEIERVLPIIKRVRKKTDIPISIDTTKAAVAEAAVGEGANLINDVSGLRFDSALARTAAGLRMPIVLMHSRKKPEDMQKEVHYNDLFSEIVDELKQSILIARESGIPMENIIVDPGIGFAKTAGNNIEILSDVSFLAPLGRPIMVGPSRKSFIGIMTGADVENRIGGTAAAVTAAVLGGANFIRVHDVGIMKQAAVIAFSMRQCHTGGN